MYRKRNVPAAPGLGLPAPLLFTVPDAEAKSPSNTQARLPNNVYLAGLASPAVCSYANGTDLVQAVNGRHGNVHITVGGTLANADISPAAVIFWPWHAFLESIYARWQDCR